MEGLGIDARLLISQIINFAVLLFLLQRLLYKPLINTMAARRQRIEESLEEADRVRQQAGNAQKEYEAQLEKARREAQESIARAAMASKKVEEEILAEAQKQKEAIIQSGREQIEQERARAMAELQEQVIELSIAAARKVVGTDLDDQTHRKLIREFLSSQLEGI
ncbi:MAG: F0F1 ATP synthase subunit B [Chloroflexi bacterium]|nr:F0F1 ATP synthase subunit B [Chloroflexota bacterium]